MRELHEELGIFADEGRVLRRRSPSPAIPTRNSIFWMPLYVCRRFEGIPVGREGQAIKG